MQTKTIEITVDIDGQTQITTKGFHGPSCRQASEFLEQALGQTTGERLTPEFHTVTNTQQQHSRHG